MPIQTEVWAADIAANIFPKDSWVSKSISDDSWVENKTVHLPQSGAAPSVVKDRATVPAVAVPRTDVLLDYNINEFTTDPSLIRDVDAIEVSYDKRSSVLSDHIKEINKRVSNELQFKWAPGAAANIIRTSGALRPANTPGATTSRKTLTIADVINAANILDDMDIERDNMRCLLLPAHMYNDLMAVNYTSLLQLQTTGEAMLKDGKLMNLHGFTIYIRGKLNVLRYNASATPVVIDPTTAGAATDNAAALVWHSDYVRRAKGSVKVYYDEDKPEYYGSIFSAMARCGGSKKYSSSNGVVAIVETA
jgi:hypothetical protein